MDDKNNPPDMEEIKDPLEKIRIKIVTGGVQRDWDDLLMCYFQHFGNPGHFRMYNKFDEHLFTAPMELTEDTKTFRFIYGGTLWTVTNFCLLIAGERSTANGDWRNERHLPEDDDGTFHAQAGGGGAEEAVSSATA